MTVERGGLMRAAQVARQPHGIGRQQGGQRLKQGSLAAVGVDVALALVPAMPMVGPLPRYKVIPYTHPEE